MRLRYLTPLALIVCLAAGGAATAHAAGDRQRTFADAAGAMRSEWDRDQAQGVPASSLDPLRSQLAAQAPTAAWWSPAWLQDDGRTVLQRLRDKTHAAWNAAIDAQRTQAQALIAQWGSFSSAQSTWLSSAATTSAAGWQAQLDAASTPASIAALVSSWKTFLGQQQAAIVSAQQAKLATELRSAGGPEEVLATARRLVAVAESANLDSGNVATLAAQLSDQIAGNRNTEALATGADLLTAVASLQSLVNLNNEVGAQVTPLLFSVDQARAEATPNAAAFVAQNVGIADQYRAARTTEQLKAVAQTIATLQGQVNGELAASQCGHAVGSGKVITMSLSLQEMLFYQDGCVVKATPISTGRPQLRTPTGTFSIFYKKTPFTFISPWPQGSPFYYPPSPVSWVMEFAAGGFFIHDAPWEALSAYGPGSEDNPAAASHGCVHTPTPVMQWAFDWTPLGTPVIISA